MNYGLDIDVATHEFVQCSISRLKNYRTGGWRVIAVVTDPPVKYASNDTVIFVLVRKKYNPPKTYED